MNSSSGTNVVVAYLANLFPASVEPYVGDEIQELTRRGVVVVPCSVKRPAGDGWRPRVPHTHYLQPLSFGLLVKALGLCLKQWNVVLPFVWRALRGGRESIGSRLRALLHTWIGAYLALLLRPYSVRHIHAHHGYAAAWIAMVAARLLQISYSLTLHGSDLLVDGKFIDIKLEQCRCCFTVSEYNRKFLMARYPGIDPDKVYVQRMGVPAGRAPLLAPDEESGDRCFVMLAVGRLHPVKDHAFLIRGCAQLKALGAKFVCLIAGDGSERRRLERLAASCGLEQEIQLLGHVQRDQLAAYYARADLVVLTSRSEGVPLTLMEAMARGKPVLAPAITGIPELVADGQTGFLYQPGSLEDFVLHVEMVRRAAAGLNPIRRAARQHVCTHFEREKNLQKFADLFLAQVRRTEGTYENSLHQ
jgi:glycosyltransferase involved in cell wall biosynthesis